MTDELHIASLVVHANPKRMDEVSRQVGEVPGACIHASSPNGKLVVTLEAASSDEILGAVNCIQRMDGVMSAALVYQYADSRDAMMEEISDEVPGQGAP